MPVPLLAKLVPPAWRTAVRHWLSHRWHRATAIGAIVWLIFLVDWLCVDTMFIARLSEMALPSETWVQLASHVLRWLAFTGALVIAGAWCRRTLRDDRQHLAVVATLALFPVWHWLVFAFDFVGSRSLAVACANVGTVAAFLAGLAWVVYGVERGSQFYRRQREANLPAPASVTPQQEADRYLESHLQFQGEPSGALTLPGKRNWNPIDLEAWYYGRRSPKLNQSISTILTYTLVFFLLVWLFNQLGGCQELYEMPAGGGEVAPKVQVVKIQKVIRKKFVINPFSAVVFNPPPIEEVKLNLQELTKHAYVIGQGKGTGAGFSGGTNRGKVRFIRLEYKGGDWDQDFGVGADLNLLLRYGIETGHQVSEKTESRTIEELNRFPVGKSPPFVYMTGQQSIQLSKRETEILREYLLDKHGMIFADNGGSAQFHAQFFSMMDKVLEGTGVYPVKVPLDDIIHRIPFTLPFLPYVAPHGGKEAYGWYKDGRWLAYYHPGDIGDAWSDGHAGVRKEIYEACFHLGVNVMFYAHAEYNKWLESREKKD